MKLQQENSHSRSNLNERGIMMNCKKTLAATLVATALLGLGGCSSDDAAVAVHKSYTRVAPLATQTATIEIHDPNGIPTVVVSGQPADIELSGTAMRTGTTVDLYLNATNNASRVLFNLKAVLDTATSTLGTATIGQNDGTFDGKEFVRFDMALGKGDDSNAGMLELNTIDATDPIVLKFTLPTDHPMAVVNQEWGSSGDNIRVADLMANQSQGVDLTKIHNPNGGNQNSSDSARLRAGMFSPDGQYVYAGLRNVPWLVRIDVTTGDYELMDMTDGSIRTAAQVPDPSVVVSKVLTAYTDWLAMSPDDKYLYALLGIGDHAYGSNSNIEPQTIKLIKIERDSLKIVDSVTLLDGMTAEARVRDFDFHGNDTMVVILESDDETINPAEVISLDLKKMEVTNRIDISPAHTQIRVDAAAALVPPVVLSPSPDNDPTQMALSADGNTAYVTFRGNVDIYTVNLANGDVDPMGTTLADTYAHALELGPDGKLYVATEGDSLMAIDTANANAETLVYNGSSVTGMAFSADGTVVYVHDYNGNNDIIRGFKLSDYSELDLDGDTTGTVGPHTSISNINGWDEMLLISPY